MIDFGTKIITAMTTRTITKRITTTPVTTLKTVDVVVEDVELEYEIVSDELLDDIEDVGLYGLFVKPEIGVLVGFGIDIVILNEILLDPDEVTAIA